MKFGLQVSSFTWPGGSGELAPTLARVVRTADEAGLDSIWVMDHLFQIRSVGSADEPMLEGWTALGFIAAHTEKARIGLMVGGVHYRDPGIWVKAATTLDVLSGGRAWLGIGAGWNAEESHGLGFEFPSLGTRFEMLEETLQIAHQMFEGDLGTQGKHAGKHYRATRLLNSPQSISRPRVPIMIGGGGERKTLRLVAQYGDACNVGWGSPESVAHKLGVLRRHCEDVGRPNEEIERTTLAGGVRITRDGADRSVTPEQLIDRFAQLGDAGAQHVLFNVRDVWETDQLELFGTTVIPALRNA